MCECCLADVRLLKNQPLEGWFLGRAFKSSSAIKKGQWTLTIMNSPEFIIKGELIKDPLFHKTDQEIDSCSDEEWKNWGKFSLFVDRNRETFVCHPSVGFNFVIACSKAGYKKEEDGDIIHWLLNYLAEWIEKYPEFEEGGRCLV